VAGHIECHLLINLCNTLSFFPFVFVGKMQLVPGLSVLVSLIDTVCVITDRRALQQGPFRFILLFKAPNSQSTDEDPLTTNTFMACPPNYRC
jgi:hypothetical protein